MAEGAETLSTSSLVRVIAVSKAATVVASSADPVATGATLTFEESDSITAF
jgi:hypothetical protein